MTWLAVLGTTPFAFAHPETRKMVNFAPGVHSGIDEMTEGFVRRSMPHPLLVLGEGDPPTLEVRGADLDPAKGLTPAHLRLPVDSALILAASQVEDALVQDAPEGYDYRCQCGRDFPSKSARTWHWEVDGCGAPQSQGIWSIEEDDPEPPPDDFEDVEDADFEIVGPSLTNA